MDAGAFRAARIPIRAPAVAATDDGRRAAGRAAGKRMRDAQRRMSAGVRALLVAAGRGTHRPPACSRRAGGKRAFERPPRDRPKELTQILRSAGEHVPRRWVLGEPKPADGPVFWWANNGRKSSCSPAARRRPRWFGSDVSIAAFRVRPFNAVSQARWHALNAALQILCLLMKEGLTKIG